MDNQNNITEYIVLNLDLVDGRITRAKKFTEYPITYEDDYAVYFTAENGLVCGLEKENQTHKYKKIVKKEN